jgi:hypothetical protein
MTYPTNCRIATLSAVSALSVFVSRLAGKTLLLITATFLFGRGLAISQDSNPAGQTNELTLAETMDGTDELDTAEELAPTQQAGDTNSPGSATASSVDGRTRRLLRQKRSRNRAESSQQNGSALSRGTNAVGSLDYLAFRLVAERNIFDPNRQPHTSGPRSQPKAKESFTLVGTMSYDKGDFAFFDGTSSDYKKVLKPAETIAGYRVVSILPDSVKLERESKDIDLPVGSQLRHQDDGTWVKAAGAGVYAASTTEVGSSQTETAPSGTDSDILKRLMQRREKENSP